MMSIKMSHPTWVRGLKLDFSPVVWQVLPVAPYVGAWIETTLKEFEEIST